MNSFSLGIDICGTFTDIIINDPGIRQISVWKELTHTGNPGIMI